MVESSLEILCHQHPVKIEITAWIIKLFKLAKTDKISNKMTGSQLIIAEPRLEDSQNQSLLTSTKSIGTSSLTSMTPSWNPSRERTAIPQMQLVSLLSLPVQWPPNKTKMLLFTTLNITKGEPTMPRASSLMGPPMRLLQLPQRQGITLILDPWCHRALLAAWSRVARDGLGQSMHQEAHTIPMAKMLTSWIKMPRIQTILLILVRCPWDW